MPAYLELILDQGTTFIRDITLTDDYNGANINLVNHVVSCNARKSYSAYSQTSIPDIVFKTELLDSQNGLIRISQTAANTANYYPRRYFYDILITDGGGTRTRVLEGTLTVSPSVS